MRLLTPALATLLLTVDASAAPVDQAYVRLFQRAAPAVVLVTATDGTTTSQGTGFFVTADGRVLTNLHVVSGPAGRPWPRVRILVRTDSAEKLKRVPARVVASDKTLDLALLAVSAPGFRAPSHLTLADSDHVRVGTRTAAIGHPAGGTAWTLTAGVVGARRSDPRPGAGQHLFQSNTDLNPGNSGGPLLELGGGVIGVNTGIIRQGPDGTILTGLNLSIQSNVARRWLATKGLKLPRHTGDPPPVVQAPLPPGTTIGERELEALSDKLGAEADAFFDRARRPRSAPAP